MKMKNSKYPGKMKDDFDWWWTMRLMEVEEKKANNEWQVNVTLTSLYVTISFRRVFRQSMIARSSCLYFVAVAVEISSLFLSPWFKPSMEGLVWGGKDEGWTLDDVSSSWVEEEETLQIAQRGRREIFFYYEGVPHPHKFDVNYISTLP